MPKQYYQGEPIGYNITYNPVNFKSDLKFMSVNYTTNTTTLKKLDVYTKYYINVSAVSSGGVGPAKLTFASTGASTILFLSCLLTGSLVLIKESFHFSFDFTCSFNPPSHFHIRTKFLRYF